MLYVYITGKKIVEEKYNEDFQIIRFATQRSIRFLELNCRVELRSNSQF